MVDRGHQVQRHLPQATCDHRDSFVAEIIVSALDLLFTASSDAGHWAVTPPSARHQAIRVTDGMVSQMARRLHASAPRFCSKIAKLSTVQAADTETRGTIPDCGDTGG
jgi:hypothetical protein